MPDLKGICISILPEIIIASIIIQNQVLFRTRWKSNESFKGYFICLTIVLQG